MPTESFDLLSDYRGRRASRLADHPSVLTYTGRQYSFFDPKIEQIDILDIAHGLSLICRYGGQCARFLSVAEHSVLVSHLVSAPYALDGLMHDAAEAYCGDMILPLKIVNPDFQAIVRISEDAIGTRFRLSATYTDGGEVHYADRLAYHVERGVLFPSHYPRIERYAHLIRCWDPFDAKILFLRRFQDLVSQMRPTT